MSAVLAQQEEEGTADTFAVLTVWQPWATLIMVEAKPLEFRSRAAPAHLVGKRIAIHSGAKPISRSEVDGLLARVKHGRAGGTGLVPELAIPVLEEARANPTSFQLGAILGTAKLGQPREVERIFSGRMSDSERKNHEKWAWPMMEVEPWTPVVPARGKQGWWYFTRRD